MTLPTGRISSGLRVITRQSPTLPLPGLHLLCSFPLLFILQQISLIIYHVPANQEKSIISGHNLCDLLKLARLSSLVGQAVGPFILFGIRVLSGKACCRFHLCQGPISIPSTSSCLWAATTELFGSGFHLGALEGSKCEKHHFPDSSQIPLSAQQTNIR